ncbi:WGS project CAFE00000000 data, contig [Burkholderia sp. IT-111MI5]
MRHWRAVRVAGRGRDVRDDCEAVDKCCDSQSIACGGATTDWMIRRVGIRSNFVHRARLTGHGVLPVPGCRAESFRAAASQRFFGGDRAASFEPASGIASTPSTITGHFSSKKYRCKNSTLQLSSYVVESRVFHMMRRRFTQVFVASKALNHLQLSLTIARIC